MHRVVILQPYVPQYRVAFFNHLIASAATRGIEIIIAGGSPTGAQARRRDASSTGFIHPIRQWEFRLLHQRVVLRRVPRFAREADLLIMEQARRNLDAYALFLPHFFRQGTIALWGHGKDFVSAPSRASRYIQRALTLRADWFFAYTDGGARAASQMGFPADRITTVRNSIDTSELRKHLNALSTSDIENFKRDLALKHKTAVFLGGLDASKRLDFLLEAGTLVHESDRDFRMIVVGDGEERRTVEQAARTHSWLNYLGPLAGRDKALALASSSLICMPGRVGLVAVDSFESGRPIVTTDWQWHAPEYEYLVHEETSVILNNSVQDYAKGMLDLIGDEGKISRLQRNCRIAAESYTVEGMAFRFLEGIESALKVGESQ